MDARAAALGRAEDAETRAARLAGRCERLTRRLYPDGGAPDDDRADGEPRNEADPEHPENLASGTLNSSSDALLVLRATLQGHPVGHDLDVTEALRARLRARGNARLSIAVSENLRAELFGDAFPKVDAFPKAEAGKTGRLIIEYAHAGAYYGGVTPSAVTSNPDAVAVNVKDVKDVKDGTRAPNKNDARIRGAACVATVTIGGVDTNEPFAVSSLWIDASPAAADAAARHAEARVRDAERAFASVKAKLTRAEARVAELADTLNPLRARCEAAERREKALAEAARASAVYSESKTKEASRFESEARRAVDVADAARARARRAVDAARDEAERRVAEAVRDERARLEQKAREVRLASAAERRRRAGDSGTVGTTTRKTESETKKSAKSAWGVPRTTPSSLSARSSRDFVAENKKLASSPSPFDVAGFLDAGEAAAAEEKKTSPADAGYKTRAKASAAAAAEAEAWAAARASAAAEVAAEVTRARRTIRRNAPVLVESSASGISDAEGESLATRAAASDADKKKRPDDDDAGQKTNARSVFEAHRARSPARVRKADEDTADEGRRRAEARVRAFQRRETERLARSRRSAGRTGDVQVERSAERPPPRFTAAERRAAAAEASTAEKLRLARAALADAEVDGVRLEEALRRAADADRFEEELASARRRAAQATLTEK